jgi:hypothetical protein
MILYMIKETHKYIDRSKFRYWDISRNLKDVPIKEQLKILFDPNTKMPTSTVALLYEMIDQIVVETINRGKNNKIQHCSDIWRVYIGSEDFDFNADVFQKDASAFYRVWHLSTGILLPSISKNDWYLLIRLLKHTKLIKGDLINRSNGKPKIRGKNQ